MSDEIEATATWIIAAEPAEARRRLEAVIASRPGGVETASDTEIHAKGGSQLLVRLLGGLFGSLSWFPVRVDIGLTPVDDGTQVSARVHEALGFGIKSGMKGKYQKAVEEYAAALQQA